jgi:signal transduction histidine kinase
MTQSLYSVTLLAELSARSAGSGDLENVKSYSAQLGQVAQQALKEMRLLVYELRSQPLDQEGLAGALQQRLDAVEGRAGIEARLLVDGEVDLPATVEEHFYRIAQEALNNATRHAVATSVTVQILADNKHAAIEVIDDGCGFDTRAGTNAGGMGLRTMRERAEQVGGVLTIVSAPGEGTRVRVSVAHES